MKSSHDIDVVFINPGNRRESYQGLSAGFAAIEPPLWAGLMASHARKQGFSAAIIDSNALNLTFDETAAKVADYAPRLVVIVVYGHNPSASTQNMPAAGGIAKAIKAQKNAVPVLLVGGHAAALPERTMQEEEIDFTSDGEGVRTIVELLHVLKTTTPDFSKISDLWYRECGKTVRSSARAPLLTDLDRHLPDFAWDLLPMDRYRAHNWHCFGGHSRQPYAAIYTSLGCPFACHFCCIHAPFKSGQLAMGMKSTSNSYRQWTSGHVLSRLTLLAKKYGVVNVKFADELFIFREKQVASLCNGIISAGLRLNIWAYARVDTLRTIDLGLLKQAGINWLALGIESANSRVRDDCNKAYGGDVRTVVKRIKDAGINVIGNFMFGLPADTHETMQETLDLALELQCEYVNFNCAMAYPGSKLYEVAVRNSWPLPENWSGYSQLSINTLPLPTRFLTGPEVLAFRDKAFQKYFSDQGYLSMMESKFGKSVIGEIDAVKMVSVDRKNIYT